MINFEEKTAYTVEDLRRIVHLLRAPGGCPWDGAQTHESIRRNFLEEAYEVAEAIDEKNPAHLKEELGDVLLQVLFHASIEEDAGRFTLDDVADGICKKLIFRHPHVFGGAVATPDSWEELKRQEKGQTTYTATLQSVAKSLPGLWRAEKIQKKAAKVGFDWPDVSGALEKLREEAGELEEAVREDTNVAEELGDLLFAAVNVARFVKVDPEDALSVACDKFARRFRQVEASAAAQGKTLDEMTLAEMDRLWDEAKKQEA